MLLLNAHVILIGLTQIVCFFFFKVTTSTEEGGDTEKAQLQGM